MKFDEIFSQFNTEMIALSVSRAASEDVLRPVFKLIDSYGIIAHLVDDEKTLREMIKSIDGKYLDHPDVIIHNVENDQEAAACAVKMVADNTCNILMKGQISTSFILKEVLNKEHNLIESKLLSHVAVFDLPNYHKSILLTDAAMNIAPGTEEKKLIINNAVDFARKLNIQLPKVAILSAVEKINPKISTTLEAENIINSYNRDESLIDGPLQYDLAISKEAAATKGIRSEVAGDADILIAPQIEAGNILYKSLVYSAGSSVAATILGAKVPIVLTSRADSAEDKYNSICLAMKSIT
ncbi:phosphate acyltransferase [Salinicoccus sp. YB14-2]|uniref:phosphate acyltransferase n=1 Tax=Salinicoccus sp. YB14-2 TaxID=1572701 RepID=UPI00068A493B|nr:phosphate acyltransferase [Salinicoccus sp. YB14-2]